MQPQSGRLYPGTIDPGDDVVVGDGVVSVVGDEEEANDDWQMHVPVPAHVSVGYEEYI